MGDRHSYSDLSADEDGWCGVARYPRRRGDRRSSRRDSFPSATISQVPEATSIRRFFTRINVARPYLCSGSVSSPSRKNWDFLRQELMGADVLVGFCPTRKRCWKRAQYHLDFGHVLANPQVPRTRWCAKKDEVYGEGTTRCCESHRSGRGPRSHRAQGRTSERPNARIPAGLQTAAGQPRNRG